MYESYAYDVSSQNSLLQVLTYLRVHESTVFTISEICEAVFLSRTTVRKVVLGLVGRGIITRKGKGGTTQVGGKPPQVYHFNPDSRVSIGLVFSTSDVFVQVLNLGWRVLFEFTMPVAYDLPVAEIALCIRGVQERLEGQHGIHPGQTLGIAIGSHGIVDPSRGVVVTSVHSSNWKAPNDLVAQLRMLLPGTVPVYVDNAVRFRTLAECQIGVLQGVHTGILVHVSPQGSMVAGILLDGKIRRGLNSLVGAVGHLKVNVNDREQCDCGGYGCFEMQVGARRIVQRYRELAGGSELCSDGDPGVIERVFRLSGDGDVAAMQVVQEIVAWFSIALQNIRLLHDPEVIVFQGVFSRIGDDFTSRVQEGMGRVSFTGLHPCTAVVNSQLSETAGAFGAALYAMLNGLGE